MPNPAGMPINPVLVTSVTGIVVSGVIGPAITSWAARRAARRQFLRDQAATRREDLRSLLDEAAAILGVGPTRLREAWEGADSSPSGGGLSRWSDDVHVLGQRLQLRLGPDDPVVACYQDVLEHLVNLGDAEPGDREEHYLALLAAFERARNTFLAAGRSKLLSPVRESEPQ